MNSEDKRSNLDRAFQTIANRAIGRLIKASDRGERITTKLICDVEHDVIGALSRVFFGCETELTSEAVEAAMKGGNEE